MLDPMETLDRRARLARLEGRLCPICRTRGQMRVLTFSGGRLGCLAAHGWSNPDVAEAEIVESRPMSDERTQQLSEWASDLGRKLQAAAEADAQRLLGILERAVGEWLPPEARRE